MDENKRIDFVNGATETGYAASTLKRATSHDILFSKHAPYHCLNIGLFYIRPTLVTLNWFRDFLEWYHTYPYEVDQRGLDAITFQRSPCG